MIDDVGVLPDVQESTDWTLVFTELLVHFNESVYLIPSPLLDRSRKSRT